MGLMASEGEQGIEHWELVADTGSLEEDLGPMQLHAAGTSGGFTALQLVCNRSGSLTCAVLVDEQKAAAGQPCTWMLQ